MKKAALIVAMAAIVFTGCKNTEKKEVPSDSTMETVDSTSTEINSHNSQNSLDWAGVYEGTTPCADCEGIKTVIALKEDKTYTLSMTYLGKPESKNEYKQEGSFTWDDTGSKIILKTDGQPIALKVGENQVWLLGGDGNVIEGDIAPMFILKKTA